jgi:hypothetical protein
MPGISPGRRIERRTTNRAFFTGTQYQSAVLLAAEVPMAASYSRSRERVIKDAEAGVPSKMLAERYHVTVAWVDRHSAAQAMYRRIVRDSKY